ncbi:MAG: ATP-binding protein [Phormidesmis sp.]
MPTFPTPSCRVPDCLNPLSVRHVLLVAYWIYGCPTALKYYLYSAEPALYKSAHGGGMLKTLTIRAYRNLYFCLPLTVALLSVGLSAIALQLLPSSVFSWSHWVLGLFMGNIIGIVFLIIFSITFSLTAGTARGAASGSIVSVAAGVANATVLAVVLGRSPDWSFTQFLTPGNFGVVVLFGMVIGTSVALTIGGIIGGITGIITGLASGTIAGTVFGIIATALNQLEISSLAYATIIGLAAGGAFGASMTFASCLIICLVMGVFIGLSIDVALYQNAIATERALLYGAIATLIVWTGTLRVIPFHIGYLLYLAIKAVPGLRLQLHPIAWDELMVLPLPGTYQYLENSLNQNPALGLQQLIRVARNPLHRPIVQRILKKYLSQTNNFLPSLYRFLDNPASRAYVFAPVGAIDWERLPTAKQLLLGELSSQWVNCTAEPTSYRVERFIYGMTWLQRDHVRTAQTAFYQLLYDISYSPETQSERFNLLNYAPVYSAFGSQPGGAEMSQSLGAIAQFLSYTHTAQLSQADELAMSLPPASDAIRPDVVDILSRLSQVARDISTAKKSNSLFIQQGSLLRANSTLEALNKKVLTEVVSPEFKLLKRIIEQWSRFIIEAGGEVARLNRIPSFLKNPYIIGTPVTGDALIGREDILKRIADELFTIPGQCPSIVLYGHRRMGKSSILRNLSAYLPSPKIKIVDFNMQVLGHVSNTGELLYALARQIYRSLMSSLMSEQASHIAMPEREKFTGQNPYHALNDFFQLLSQILGGYSFIIAIDEFEKIEEKIEKGQLSESLLEFLRGLTQTYSWFSLVFAGLHTLEEMCHSYWHPFFTSIPIRVSFLPADAAKQIIIQANNIAYHEEVIGDIVSLTNGQPYLIQLICHTLVAYFNRNLLSQKKLDDPFLLFNLQDLQTVLNSSEFYSIGNAYFKGIWLQAFNSPVIGQIEILKQLALQPMSAHQVVQATCLTSTTVALALNTLREHDVVTLKKARFTYTVELMRMWVESCQL